MQDGSKVYPGSMALARQILRDEIDVKGCARISNPSGPSLCRQSIWVSFFIHSLPVYVLF
eukprot:2892434-Amphidinium_carterae.1